MKSPNLEEEFINAKECMTALVFGHKIKEESTGIILFLNDNGEIVSSAGEFDLNLGVWRSIAEVDWYSLGESLSNADNCPSIKCTVANDCGVWKEGVNIIAFIPSLDEPYVSSEKEFYSMAIIESASPWFNIPLMEIL